MKARLSGTRFAALAIASVTVLALPVGGTQLSGHPSFLPAVLALVLAFDLMGVALLRGQFHSDGDPRLLALSWAYSWSLVVMVGYALAFPGVVGTPGPLQTWTSVAPYLWVSWHAGFPLLIGLAFAPWPRRWARGVPVAQRTRLFWQSTGVAVATAAALVVVVVLSEGWAPSVISGLDTTRMTQLCGPGMAVCCLLGTWWAWRGTRDATGPARWAPVAATAVCADALLTLSSLHRFSLGWYGGRLLTVLAAGVVLVAMLADVERTRRLLSVEQARLLGLLEHSDGPISIKDLYGRYLVVNPAVAEFLGQPVAEILGRTPEELLRDGSASIAPAEAQVVASGRSVHTEDTVVAPDGTTRTFLTHRFLLRDASGEPVALAGIGTDVTELHRVRDALELQVRTDSLTGLPNRAALHADLGAALADGSARGGALVLVDLDGFKGVNDTLGHAVGDTVIVEAGRRLAAAAAAQGGSVARLGGDELVMWLAPGPQEVLLAAAQDALASLARPVAVADSRVPSVVVSGSAGLTWLDGQRDVGAALRMADLALYRSKAQGRGRLTVHDGAALELPHQRGTAVAS